MKPSLQRISFLAALLLGHSLSSFAQVLPEAVPVLRMPLTVKPTSRPMSVAYDPDYNCYIVADGGFKAMPDEFGMVTSKSQVHVYDAKGIFVQSAKPGLSNRSVYYNPNQHRIEAVTYNASSDMGFEPNTGVFALEMDKNGQLTDNTETLGQSQKAFGKASTFASYDPVNNQYYCKQENSDKVLIVKLDKDEPVGEISLDLAAAGVHTDDISEYWVAFTGIPGEELAALDVDHKCVLVFDLKGKFVGRSALPATLKLHANNHFNGHGYANGMFFVFNEGEGEFGTYYGFHISDQAQTR
ncbi:hypothetical protein GALL_343600 [mine drainage metagenome]|uniref:Uncharacterized protein n=1 Tax=mine drainage metagenome TaxID=410659 RepID=A0A1J5QJX9_9ZZZZ